MCGVRFERLMLELRLQQRDILLELFPPAQQEHHITTRCDTDAHKKQCREQTREHLSVTRSHYARICNFAFAADGRSTAV